MKGDICSDLDVIGPEFFDAHDRFVNLMLHHNPRKTMSELQKLELARIRLTSFNNFDGPLVQESLEANWRLWDALIFNPGDYTPIMHLRDMRHGEALFDTMYLLTSPDSVLALVGLLGKLHADEIGWIGSKDNDWSGVGGSEGVFGPRAKTADGVCRALGRPLTTDEVLVRAFWD